MWVKTAVVDRDYVVVTYLKWNEGTCWKEHTEYLLTSPSGNWTRIEFAQDSATSYLDFLNAMVVKTIDIKRRIAKISLDHALESEKYTEIMNYITILDPTFDPPIFNQRARWQRELEKQIAKNTSLVVLSTCFNEKNLEKYSKTLMLL
jgi:hypothetical protein